MSCGRWAKMRAAASLSLPSSRERVDRLQPPLLSNRSSPVLAIVDAFHLVEDLLGVGLAIALDHGGSLRLRLRPHELSPVARVDLEVPACWCVMGPPAGPFLHGEDPQIWRSGAA